MSKIDDNEILRRLKLLSQIEPTSEATEQAVKRTRSALTDKENRRQNSRTKIWSTIFKSNLSKLAAAAVIIVAIGLIAVFVHRGTGEKPDTTMVSEIAKSPVEMMTAMSLERAFRRGGIEAVEKQFERALEMLGPRPAQITVKELLAEFNGT